MTCTRLLCVKWTCDLPAKEGRSDVDVMAKITALRFVISKMQNAITAKKLVISRELAEEKENLMLRKILSVLNFPCFHPKVIKTAQSHSQRCLM